jgi:hypothetical protein
MLIDSLYEWKTHNYKQYFKYLFSKKKKREYVIKIILIDDQCYRKNTILQNNGRSLTRGFQNWEIGLVWDGQISRSG